MVEASVKLRGASMLLFWSGVGSGLVAALALALTFYLEHEIAIAFALGSHFAFLISSVMMFIFSKLMQMLEALSHQLAGHTDEPPYWLRKFMDREATTKPNPNRPS